MVALIVARVGMLTIKPHSVHLSACTFWGLFAIKRRFLRRNTAGTPHDRSPVSDISSAMTWSSTSYWICQVGDWREGRQILDVTSFAQAFVKGFVSTESIILCCQTILLSGEHWIGADYPFRHRSHQSLPSQERLAAKFYAAMNVRQADVENYIICVQNLQPAPVFANNVRLVWSETVSQGAAQLLKSCSLQVYTSNFLNWTY